MTQSSLKMQANETLGLHQRISQIDFNMNQTIDGLNQKLDKLLEKKGFGTTNNNDKPRGDIARRNRPIMAPEKPTTVLGTSTRISTQPAMEADHLHTLTTA